LNKIISSLAQSFIIIS